MEFARVMPYHANAIARHSKVLVVVRGSPGAGVARRIAESFLGLDDVHHHLISTDGYFKTIEAYHQDPFTRIQQAGQWILARALDAMSCGLSPIIVDGTTSQAFDERPYPLMAFDYGYAFETVGDDPTKLTRRSHAIPIVEDTTNSRVKEASKCPELRSGGAQIQEVGLNKLRQQELIAARPENRQFSKRHFQRAADLELLLQDHLQGSDTLDLHGLGVRAAIAVLDLFIDQHVDALCDGSSRNMYLGLYIVTGRGNNSPGRVPKIKPAAITRIQERQIRYSEDNPGCLKITVTQDTLRSSDFAR